MCNGGGGNFYQQICFLSPHFEVETIVVHVLCSSFAFSTFKTIPKAAFVKFATGTIIPLHTVGAEKVNGLRKKNPSMFYID